MYIYLGIDLNATENLFNLTFENCNCIVSIYGGVKTCFFLSVY